MANILSGLFGGQWSDDPMQQEQMRRGALAAGAAGLDTHGKPGGRILSQMLSGFTGGQDQERAFQLKEADSASERAYRQALTQQAMTRHTGAMTQAQLFEAAAKLAEQKEKQWMLARNNAFRQTQDWGKADQLVGPRPTIEAEFGNIQRMFGGGAARMLAPSPQAPQAPTTLQAPGAAQAPQTAVDPSKSALFDPGASPQAGGPPPGVQFDPTTPSGLAAPAPLSRPQMPMPGTNAAAQYQQVTGRSQEMPSRGPLFAPGGAQASPVQGPGPVQAQPLPGGVAPVPAGNLPRGMGGGAEVQSIRKQIATELEIAQQNGEKVDRGAIEALTARYGYAPAGDGFVFNRSTGDLIRLPEKGMAFGPDGKLTPQDGYIGTRSAIVSGEETAKGLASSATQRLNVVGKDGQPMSVVPGLNSLPTGPVPADVRAKARQDDTVKSSRARFDKVMADQEGRYVAADTNIAMVRNARNLLPLETGKWEELTLPVRQFLASTTGLPEKQMRDLVATEGFTALMDKILVTTQGDFKGAVSNVEFETSKRTIAGLGKTREANEFILDTIEAFGMKEQLFNEALLSIAQRAEADPMGVNYDAELRDLRRNMQKMSVYELPHMERWRGYSTRAVGAKK